MNEQSDRKAITGVDGLLKAVGFYLNYDTNTTSEGRLYTRKEGLPKRFLSRQEKEGTSMHPGGGRADIVEVNSV